MTPTETAEQMVRLDEMDETKLVLTGPTTHIHGFPDTMTVTICKSDVPVVLSINAQMARRIIAHAITDAIRAAQQETREAIRKQFCHCAAIESEYRPCVNCQLVDEVSCD